MNVYDAETVPASRIRRLVTAPPRANGAYVLYWMIASRRLSSSFALQRAVEWANERGVPLLVFEPLRVGYPHASDRLHRFVLDGMADNARAAEAHGVTCLPYVEPRPGDGRGLLRALAQHAVAVVTDDAPWFHYPAMLQAAARQVEVPLEAVDGDGLLPMRLPERAFSRAVDFRRFLQRALPAELRQRPAPTPLDALERGARAEVPSDVLARWAPASGGLLRGDATALAALPIDHGVPPVDVRGGHQAARERLDAFVTSGLDRYATDRNHPDTDSSSHLSAWLHFGHLAADEVFDAIASRVGWTPGALSDRADGRREGWWGMPAGPEAFLDQLVTWRELGRNFCAHRTDSDRYESLPAWARQSLEAHAADPRLETYPFEQLDAARTDDEVWNAAQNQLRREGRIHDYLRMLWGKLILAWAPGPREALQWMLALNDRYALDGRDPNSTSGVFWVLGRYDRAWGPERPVFGKVRYMTSRSARQKLRMGDYLARYAS